jgi:23S rRNA pseudouridine1911/1915/1917 synthase
MADLKVIYEDDDILVCHKKAGMATEGARAGEMDVISAARNLIARRNRSNKAGNDKGRQRNLPPYVATVNRLDKPVEGVLVLAKNKKAATSLSEQIKNKVAGKNYYALCYGIPDADTDTLEDYLIRREDTGKAMAISKEEADTFKDNAVIISDGEKVRLTGGGPKKAVLDYEIIGRTDNRSLLNITLKTGRFHQIRAQLSKSGYPILGDKDYSSAESLKYSQEASISNICLVAYRYEFKHPSTGKIMSFQIEPDNPAIIKLMKPD